MASEALEVKSDLRFEISDLNHLRDPRLIDLTALFQVIIGGIVKKVVKPHNGPSAALVLITSELL